MTPPPSPPSMPCRTYQGTVYCEDAFGGGRWIAITHVSWTLLGTREHPRRHATLDYAEVESGLVMDL